MELRRAIRTGCHCTDDLGGHAFLSTPIIGLRRLLGTLMQAYDTVTTCLTWFGMDLTGVHQNGIVRATRSWVILPAGLLIQFMNCTRRYFDTTNILFGRAVEGTGNKLSDSMRYLAGCQNIVPPSTPVHGQRQ
jgi:hypothetical protein